MKAMPDRLDSSFPSAVEWEGLVNEIRWSGNKYIKWAYIIIVHNTTTIIDWFWNKKAAVSIPLPVAVHAWCHDDDNTITQYMYYDVRNWEVILLNKVDLCPHLLYLFLLNLNQSCRMLLENWLLNPCLHEHSHSRLTMRNAISCTHTHTRTPQSNNVLRGDQNYYMCT